VTILAVIIAALSVASGIYDEIQLQHKRDHLFGAATVNRWTEPHLVPATPGN
jgi:hypothetical protein